MRRIGWKRKPSTSDGLTRAQADAELRRLMSGVVSTSARGDRPDSDRGVRAACVPQDPPLEERESVDAGIRHIEFLDAEIAAVERLIAGQALSWPEIRRLMTVPGVNLICAASFMAAVGQPSRFLTSRKLVAYLGLDPKVRQAGEAPARSGRISKRVSLGSVGAGRVGMECRAAARPFARVL